MSKENDVSISKEDCNVLMEKLSKVEELISKVPSADVLTKAVSDFEAVSKKMDSLTEAVEKMASIDDKGDVDIGKMIAEAMAPLEKEMKVLKAVPLFKGLQDGVLETPVKKDSKDIDVFKGIFGAAFPEAGGE